MRSFRFGVTATPSGSGERWREQVRSYADLGYTSLFMPDGTQLPSPFASLAMAHAVSGLTVGTFVAAAPLRTAGQAAWEAHTMSVLTGGRFEFGVGAGRPGVSQQAEELGLPFGSPGERLEQVRATVAAVRARADVPTPILLAAGGPKSRELAAEHADIVTFALDAMAGPDEYRALADDVRTRAGERADSIEFVANLFVVGDEVPPHAVRYLNVDLDAFLAAETVAHLGGSPSEMADELLRRRDRLGISYVTVNAQFCEQFAPVVERLTGR